MLLGLGKALLLCLLQGLKRLLCCIKSKQKDDEENRVVLLQSVSVDKGQQNRLTDWQDWGTPPQHSKFTNNTAAQNDDEPEQDFFADMAPTVLRQQRLFVGASNRQDQSRLNFVASPDLLPPADANLRNWDERDKGWEAEEDDVKDILREQRRHRR